MSRSLIGCKHIPGWVKPFLSSIQNGYNERNAANRAGISTTMVKQRVANDPAFKESYDRAAAIRKPRYGHGSW